MKGLVYHGKGDIRCETLPDPTPPDARGLVLKVERAAICGSDLHLYHGALPSEFAGFTVGHEFVGEVAETGSGVKNLKVGDQVMTSAVIGCGECDFCLRGEAVLCLTGPPRVFGMQPDLPGGQAEAVAVPAADHACRRIPDGVTMEQAVLLTDILPTGFFGARNAGIEPGQTVVIIGAGPVGLMALMSAQLFGAARIITLDRVAARLAMAAKLGAEAIDTSERDAGMAVLEATGGRGADAVIEAVGADETIGLAIDLVRPGGTVSVIGANMNVAMPFNMAAAFMKDLTLRVGLVPVQELWPSLVPLVAEGKLEPEHVFTHRMALSEGPRAYEIFDGRTEGVLKVLLDPSA